MGGRDKMQLEKESIKWAIKHIKKQKDTDLFPKLKEYEVLFEDEDNLIEELSKVDIGSYQWQPWIAMHFCQCANHMQKLNQAYTFLFQIGMLAQLLTK